MTASVSNHPPAHAGGAGMAARTSSIYTVVLYSVVFLSLLGLITDFIGAVYAFGLLGTSIPPEIASVLLLFAPVLLLVWPREMKRGTLVAFGLLMLFSRPVGLLLDTRGRMLVSGVGVAAGLLWVPSLLWWLGWHENEDAPRHVGLGLLVGTLFAILFRVWGSGIDLLTRGLYQIVGWGLAGTGTALLLYRRVLTGPSNAAAVRGGRRHAASVPSGQGLASPFSFGHLLVLVLGLVSAVVLLYFGFASPNVIARWTGLSYPVVVIAMVLGAGLLAVLGVVAGPRLVARNRGVLLILNVIFVAALAGALGAYQIRFPADPGGYPFYPPAVSPGWNAALVLALLLSPIIFVDFALLAGEITAGRPSVRALGGAFGVASLYLVVMVFAHVFTTVYDYIPVIGPAFRDRFWLVYLVVGVGLILPLLGVRRLTPPTSLAPGWGAVVVVVGLLVIGGVFATRARPQAIASHGSLTVMSYNIQQGYGADGQQAADRQLAVLRSAGPDIIGLAESDTNRIAGANDDLVRYYADSLDMYSTYGPPTIAGTFGIALLSRYPIENPRTFYMYSEGEQTAAIEAQVTVGQVVYRVFVTHLGNGGPIVQQEAVLAEIDGQEHVVLMGDFNFRPATEQYTLTTTVLDDAWLRRWPNGVDDRGNAPERRIDHVFISPALQVDDIRYIDSPASDHPAVLAVLQPR